MLSAAERAVGFGAWRWDRKDNVLRWSDGLYRLFGLDPGSVEPSFEKFLDLVHPDDRPRIEQAGRAAFEETRLSINEYRVVHADGTVRFVRGSSEPVRDESGETVALIGTTQDITERREMEAELERTAAARAVAQQVRAIQRILEIAITHPTVDEMLPELLRRILRLMEVEDAAILLMNPDGRALTIATTEGVEEGQVGTVVEVGAGLAGRAAAERAPVILTGDEIATVVNPALRRGGFSAVAAAPMLSGTRRGGRAARGDAAAPRLQRRGDDTAPNRGRPRGAQHPSRRRVRPRALDRAHAPGRPAAASRCRRCRASSSRPSSGPRGRGSTSAGISTTCSRTRTGAAPSSWATSAARDRAPPP